MYTDTALSREKVVPWVGAVLLESQSILVDGVSTQEFLQGWQDYLPEKWRIDATLALLKV